LGGLGLLLGTLGLAAVLLRNVLERRREHALMRAVGFRSGQIALVVATENVLLMLLGLLSGTVSALVAIAPAFAARGGSVPIAALAALLAVVLAGGVLSSLLAVAAVGRMPLLGSLRSD
jgi:ABC-type antimicrobial peptide transport system permease subunit